MRLPLPYDDRHHRPDDAARDAPIVEREVERRVERALAEAAAVARCGPLQRVGREGRRAAVLRLDHQRGLAIGLVLPAAVVAKGADRVHRAGNAILVGFLRLRELLVVEHRTAADLFRPLARDAQRGVARPHAGDVRIAPLGLRLREPLGRSSQLRGQCLDGVALGTRIGRVNGHDGGEQGNGDEWAAHDERILQRTVGGGWCGLSVEVGSSGRSALCAFCICLSLPAVPGRQIAKH